MSSTFSNPPGEAVRAAPEYTKALLDLLGDRDPLEVQAALLPELEKLTEGLSAEELRRPEKPGKWSILQVLDHLTDQEMVFGYRLRKVVAEENPPLLAYDQNVWASSLRYGTGDRDSLLQELGAFRGRNLRLLKDLNEKELARLGNHAERGPENVRRMLSLQAAHDLVHRKQVARIRAALGKPV